MQSDFFIPYQSDWREKVDPLRTPQNNPDILKAPTIYEIINEIPGVGSYFSERGGDPVVVANSHYARGAYWLTWDIEFRWGEAEVMDQVSWDKLDDYLNGKYKSGILGLGGRNKVPFSALTVWYLPGLDHKAHFKGMEEYRNYFITNTDDYIKKVVKTLKDLGEFDNKIFIIVADHGMTAMPMGLTYTDKKTGKVYDADVSCKLNLKNFDDPDTQNPERANNNLHIRELAEVLKQSNKLYSEIYPGSDIPQKLGYNILAPQQIAKVFRNSVYGAKSSLPEANVIGALNGPMAHIYVKDRTGNDWEKHGRIVEDTGYLAEVLRLLLSKDKTPSDLPDMFPEGLIEYVLFDTIGLKGEMSNSVDLILIRRSMQTGEDYCVYKGIKADQSDIECISLKSYFTGKENQYLKAVKRISGMSNLERSGDIVLIMNDDTDTQVNERFTIGVSCKSWHGSLNRSDSFVPFIVTYPGGNRYEINRIIDKQSSYPEEQSICPNLKCEGNWKMKDLVHEIIKSQYLKD